MHHYRKDISRVTIIGSILNTFLFTIKIAGGYIWNSSALIADGFHSLSDLSTDILILIGSKYWSQPCDEDHPHGHHKIESIVSLLLAIFLLFVGFDLIYSALKKLSTETVYTRPGILTIFIAIISIFSKEILFRYTIKIGKKTNSDSVILNAWHHRSDAISSIFILFSLLISIFSKKYAIVDKIGAILIGGIILQLAISSLISNLNKLSDQAAPPEFVKKIKESILSTEQVLDTHKIRTRYMGNFISLDFHILVDPDISVYEGHEIAKTVKRNILKNFPDIIDVIIHIEPKE